MKNLNHITKIILSLVWMLTLASCSHDIKIDIEGRLTDNAASEVYLIVQHIEADTISSASVAPDNTFTLKGRVKEPTTAFICDDNGNALAVFLTENARLKLTPQHPSGYIAEGGPINDKYNLILNRISSLAEQAVNIDFNEETAQEAYESIAFKYNDAISMAISDNLDNIIGVELFLSHEVRGMTAEDMRVRWGQFSEKMQRLKVMQDFEKYISIFEQIEIGKHFLDAEVENLAGETIHFKEICGRGKWVLIDFWATWCKPCLEQIPELKRIYEKYTLHGFEILAVSLDKEPDRWKSFIANNRLLWNNVIDLGKAEQSASKVYGLQTIPTNLLISPEGKIVARDLSPEVLEHELEHIFGEVAH